MRIEFEIQENLVNEIFQVLAVALVVCFLIGSIYLGLTARNEQKTKVRMAEIQAVVK